MFTLLDQDNKGEIFHIVKEVIVHEDRLSDLDEKIRQLNGQHITKTRRADLRDLHTNDS